MERTTELITNWIVALWLIFFGAFMCHLAWNGWAWEFNLPQFSYWHWVATFTAIRLIRGGIPQKEKGK